MIGSNVGSFVLLLMSTILGVIGLLGNFRSTTGRLTRRGYWLLGGLILCAVLGACMVVRQEHWARVVMEQQREDNELRLRRSKELPPPRR
jgi:hypothetical protein